MNYAKIYNNLINTRKYRVLNHGEYFEVHHIKPKCIGGSNGKENLIKLTAREHFIAHLLLSEMYIKYSPIWIKMQQAFFMMKADPSGYRYINNRIYEHKRKDFSYSQSINVKGKKNPRYNTLWIHNLELSHSLNIKKEDLPNYMDNGYKIGRIIKFDQYHLYQKLKAERNKNKEKIIFNGYEFTKSRRESFKNIFKVYPSNYEINKIIDEIYKLYTIDGISTTDLAILWNTNSETIRNWMIFFNIKRRDKYQVTINTKRKIQKTLKFAAYA